MKKTIKTEKVLEVFKIINTAKYTKMNDDDKVKAWKIARQLKPIATKFEEDCKDAAEKFKTEIKDFDERLQKAKKFEQAKKDNKDCEDMTSGEYAAFIYEFKNYQELVNKAIMEFAQKDVKVQYDSLSEDAFGKLMSSNEWTMEQAMLVGDVICE